MFKESMEVNKHESELANGKQENKGKKEKEESEPVILFSLPIK